MKKRKVEVYPESHLVLEPVPLQIFDDLLKLLDAEKLVLTTLELVGTVKKTIAPVIFEPFSLGQLNTRIGGNLATGSGFLLPKAAEGGEK